MHLLRLRNATRLLVRSGAGLALCALCAPESAAQEVAGAPHPDRSGPLDVLRPSRIVPAGPATWEAIEGRGAVTDYELGGGGGWYFMPPFLQWRFLEPSQWATSDPIAEVHVYPPYSGSTTNIESFLLQIPTTMPAPVADRALIIGFHGASISPAQIFGVSAGITDLPEICTANGWFLLGPNGINASNMACVLSQKALEVDIALIASLFQFNWEKVYTLGFSMGGLNATSFAFRHQDPYTPRVAGVIYHSGTTDIVRDYDEAPPQAKVDVWENPLVFGASPTDDPFAYDRVNPTRFNAAGTGFLDEHFQLDALKYLPFYVHADNNDYTKYSGWTKTLAAAMQSKGFTLKTKYITSPTPTHSIFTLDYDAALDYVTQFPVGVMPPGARLFADRPGRYLWSRMISNPAPNVARYEVQIHRLTNSFAVSDTHHVDTLGLDLALMGVNAAQPVSFTAQSGDGTPDTFVLTAYPAAPTAVLVDGGPASSWGYDPVTGGVTITPNSTGADALVQVIP
jgi:hypothetical protein